MAPRVASAPVPALEVAGVGKRYPGVVALHDVHLAVARGEVHGLVGANGAGKSTLIKVVTGAIRPDAGVVRVGGREVGGESLHARLSSGVAAIYQELSIVPRMSAAQNVFLGQPPRRGPFVDRRRMRREFGDLAERVGAEGIPPGTPAGRLSVAQQQLVEIMRALARRRDVLIMDEPTAALGPAEREHLVSIVGALRRQGVTMIFISHDLDEVLRVSDRVSVMRNGRLVDTRASAAWTSDGLVAAMLGEGAARIVSERPVARDASTGPEVLRAAGVRAAGGRVRGVDLAVHAGEILGIGGLVGAGRTELLRAIAGADRGAGGALWIDGAERPWPRSVRAALACGVALVPEERRTQGLVPLLSGEANVTITEPGAYSLLGWARGDRRREAARAASTPVGFDPTRLAAPAGTLSGGNQQKLVLGKWLHRRPRVLLLDEPTRGIDVGAKSEIYDVIGRLAREGMAVVVVSSELEEVVHLSDRIAVMHRGSMLGELTGPERTVERILQVIYRARVA